MKISQVKDIFADAIDRPAGERTAFVERACGDDAALRVHVLRLLEHHARAAPSATSSGATSLIDQLDPRAMRVPAEQIGDWIGPYQLVELLGEGGFGTVYRAEQHEPVRRDVALKVIKLGMDTRQVIARFELERRALAVMDHPSIAKVLDAGATETGRPYFVMELVRGGVPVTEYCDANRLTMRQRLALFGAVCGAVQHAHQKGIIHRDLKPSNVLVTLQDGAPVPKVIDFGIAKATDQSEARRTYFTEQAQVIGTPQYMSPEQAAPRGGADVDTRADIYSLGVLLYELLTGTTPFEPERLRSEAYNELLRIIREEDPPRPSTRLSALGGAELGEVAHRRRIEPQRLGRDLRGDLDWVVMKAMEKDRARRYATASALADDVARHLANEPVEARPPSVRYRAAKFVRRNRIAIGTAAVVLVAVLSGLAAMTYGLVQARRGRDAALLAQRVATAEKEKAQQVAQLLQAMLANVRPMRAQGRDTTILRDILDQTRQRVGAELRGQPEVLAEILLVIGRTYRDLALYDDAEAVIRESLELRRRTLGERSAAATESLHEFANVLLDRGKVAEAEPIVRDVVARRRAALGADHMSVAQALNDLSYVLEKQSKLDEAVDVQREVVRVVRANVSGDHPDLAASLNGMGRLLQHAGRLQEAAPVVAESLAMRQRLFGEDHTEVALSLEQVAYAQQHRGDVAAAEQTFRRIVEIRRRVYGDEHPDVTNGLNNLGWLLCRQGKYAEAEPILRRVLDVSTRVRGAEHPGTFVTANNLGAALQGLGRLEEAEQVFRDVLSGRRRVLGPEHPDTLESARRLASLYEATSRPVEAARVRGH